MEGVEKLTPSLLDDSQNGRRAANGEHAMSCDIDKVQTRFQIAADVPKMGGSALTPLMDGCYSQKVACW